MPRYYNIILKWITETLNYETSSFLVNTAGYYIITLYLINE